MKLTHSTKSIKESEVKREWHFFDAKGKVLGRLASDIAQALIGKHKVNYISHMDMGDNIVVVNALKVEVTGRKNEDKVYARYSGYPGGLTRVKYKDLQKQKPEEIIRHAVMGMLPKNKLRDRMITRLFVYKDETHPYADKFKS